MSPSGPFYSCAILTTAPSELTAKVHDRMPVIPSMEYEDVWFDLKAEHARLLSLLKSYPADDMESAPANPKLNRPIYGGPECLTPPPLD
jgi:putative SOS response-associated peptidase YedK